MPAYLGALDQGTTSTRFIVFDRGGRIVAQAQEEHQQIYPAPGWVEHDPDEIWRRTQDVIRKAMAQQRLGSRTWMKPFVIGITASGKKRLPASSTGWTETFLRRLLCRTK